MAPEMVEGLRLTSAFLIGIFTSTFGFWINKRRQRPDLGVQVQEMNYLGDWTFELVVENRWETELHVADVEFHLGRFWWESQVVKASSVPDFKDFFCEEKPLPRQHVIVKGRSVEKVQFQLVMLAMRLNQPLKAVVMVDHLGRREALGRKPLRALVSFVNRYLSSAEEKYSSTEVPLQKSTQSK